MAMFYNFFADTVTLFHAVFVLFVLFGGLGVLQWRRLAWVHIPAALWGAFIELSGWICPLTHLENYFRRLGGSASYDISFIEHYLEPILYPLGLTRNIQLVFGLTVLSVNLTIYYRFWKQSGTAIKRTQVQH